MNIDWTVVAMFAAPLVTLVAGAVLTHFVTAQSRLTAYLGHASSFRVTPENGNPGYVHTHAIVLHNAGRKAATNVRLGHTQLTNYQVFPDTQHEIKDLPNGGKEIVFPVVVPKKQITVSYLYFPPVTWNQINTHFESDEGPVTILTVIPQPQYPRWVIGTLRVLVFIGAVTSLYLLYYLVVWAIGT